MGDVIFSSYTEAATFAKRLAQELGVSVRFGRHHDEWVVHSPESSTHRERSPIFQKQSFADDALRKALDERTPEQLELDKTLTNLLVYEEISLEQAVQKGLSEPRQKELESWNQTVCKRKAWERRVLPETKEAEWREAAQKMWEARESWNPQQITDGQIVWDSWENR